MVTGQGPFLREGVAHRTPVQIMQKLCPSDRLGDQAERVVCRAVEEKSGTIEGVWHNLT